MFGSYVDHVEAFTLANTYGFSLPRSVSPARTRSQAAGKFEPDRREGESVRSMKIAHWFDKTNIIIQYHPAELEI